MIEADKVKPNRLQDILFTGTGKKGDNYKFGPVVANSIKIWKTVERRIGGPFKFCNSTPLWHNLNFVCGNRPFVQPSWSSLGVNTCGDMYDNQGLCSFQALRAKFCLPASAYFVFLQLRSALKAYGVPWSSCNLLEKGAIERIPASELESSFYSRYFVVAKRDGGLRSILDLRPINRALCKRLFRMISLEQIMAQIRPGDWLHPWI